MTMLDALVARHTEARPLAIARIGIGAAALLKVIAIAPVLDAVLAPGAMRAPYAAWLPVLPAAALPALLVAWSVTAGALALGWRTRWAAGLLVAILTYVLALDQQVYSSHLYLLTLLVFLLALADGGAALSLDARRDGGRSSVPAWPIALMKLQLSIVYGFAALAKLNIYFLSGALLSVYLRDGGLLVVPELMRTFPVVMVLAIASVLLEAYLALALWSARHRRYALVLGIGFHLALNVTISPVLQLLVFTVQSLAVYALFVDEAIWSRIVMRGTAPLSREERRSQPAVAGALSQPARHRAGYGGVEHGTRATLGRQRPVRMCTPAWSLLTSGNSGVRHPGSVGDQSHPT